MFSVSLLNEFFYFTTFKEIVRSLFTSSKVLQSIFYLVILWIIISYNIEILTFGIGTFHFFSKFLCCLGCAFRTLFPLHQILAVKSLKLIKNISWKSSYTVAYSVLSYGYQLSILYEKSFLYNSLYELVLLFIYKSLPPETLILVLILNQIKVGFLNSFRKILF